MLTESFRGPLGFTERTRVLEQRAEMTRLIDTLSPVTSAGVLAAAAVIFDARSSQHPPDEKTLKFAIDAAAVAGMERTIRGQKRYRLHTIGCEGGKEVHHYGEAAACLRDQYGHEYAHPLWAMIDPIEGTTRAAQGRHGAYSVLAITPQDGIVSTPAGIDYADKLFGPPELIGKISLALAPIENISLAISELGIRPRELHIYVLKRDRNERIISAANALGVALHLLDSGDLVPAFVAVSDRTTPTLVAGIGGIEEAMIGAVAAKVCGGLGEVQSWNNGTTGVIADVDTLVPGERHSSAVFATALTADPYFDLQPVRTLSNAVLTETLTLSMLGKQVHTHRLTLE